MKTVIIILLSIIDSFAIRFCSAHTVVIRCLRTWWLHRHQVRSFCLNRLKENTSSRSLQKRNRVHNKACWSCRQDFIWPQNVSPLTRKNKTQCKQQNPELATMRRLLRGRYVTKLSRHHLSALLLVWTKLEVFCLLLSLFVSLMYSPINVIIISLIVYSRSSLKQSIVMKSELFRWISR